VLILYCYTWTHIIELEFHTKMRAHKIIEVPGRTTLQRSTWRKDAALLDSACVTRTKYSSTRCGASELPQCDPRISDDSINQFREIVPLIFELRDELSAVLRQADAMYALRIVA
jgi:hypothetical protein